MLGYGTISVENFDDLQYCQATKFLAPTESGHGCMYNGSIITLFPDAINVVYG